MLNLCLSIWTACELLWSIEVHSVNFLGRYDAYILLSAVAGACLKHIISFRKWIFMTQHSFHFPRKDHILWIITETLITHFQFREFIFLYTYGSQLTPKSNAIRYSYRTEKKILLIITKILPTNT